MIAVVQLGLRERERLRAGFESVANCRVVLGQFGGLSALTRTLARELRHRGATVADTEDAALMQALDSGSAPCGGFFGETWLRLVSDEFA